MPFLLGDGAQKIFTGGFTLQQAGLDLGSRSVMLETNYRNTAEIIDAAMAAAGAQYVHDLGEEYKRSEAPSTVLRTGARPLLIQAADLEGQLEEIASRVHTLVGNQTFGTGDVAVLVPTNRLVEQVVGRLTESGLDAQELHRYDGRPNDLVKVGTYFRAKGLEFKAVFLPALSKGMFPGAANLLQGSAEEALEAEELAISQLFVAMTRARDVLVVLYDREPSEVLAPVLNSFEQISV